MVKESEMKIVMVMVATLNGKITKGSTPHVSQWTSKEDHAYFSSLVKESNLMVMGRKTYDSAKEHLTLEEGQLRIVLTREPERYRADLIPGQLEFSNESPQELVGRLRQKGFKQMLLLGGGEINASFLTEKLVDELHLTLEPKIFGKGKLLVAERELVAELALMSVRRLNTKGTLLLKYKVLK